MNRVNYFIYDKKQNDAVIMRYIEILIYTKSKMMISICKNISMKKQLRIDIILEALTLNYTKDQITLSNLLILK